MPGKRSNPVYAVSSPDRLVRRADHAHLRLLLARPEIRCEDAALQSEQPRPGMPIEPTDPFISLAELSEAYQTGTARPSQVIEAHLERIARLDPKIGAYQVVYADEARLAAEAADKAIASDPSTASRSGSRTSVIWRAGSPQAAPWP
jgi:hypothetical protein